jgi:hypothetical protein
MMGEQRRRDLESHVQKTLELLKEYEDQLRLSDDPRKKRRLEGEITQLRQLLASYQAQLAAPGQPDGTSRVPIEFVNRENELHLLHVERLRAARSPYTLISAPAGYGKTYLLQRLLHTVESDETLRQRWCSRYVDCGAGAGDQVDHVVYAITETSQQHGNGPDAATDRVCDCVVQELSAPYPEGRRAVLLIFDAVERLEEAARAWLYALLHELRRRTRLASQDIITVRVIVAGRNAELFWEGYERA